MLPEGELNGYLLYNVIWKLPNDEVLMLNDHADLELSNGVLVLFYVALLWCMCEVDDMM